jgi:OOP family OmpA-OmpF porin
MRALIVLLVLATAAAAEPKVSGSQIVTETIYYDTGKATIKSDSLPVLDQIAALMEREKKLGLVEIGVHTDARGNDAFNLKLSQARAEAVRDYLVSKGISATRLRAKGYGEKKPLDNHANEAAWAKNRRTELVILQRKTT